jgi:hypothetical protein
MSSFSIWWFQNRPLRKKPPAHRRPLFDDLHLPSDVRARHGQQRDCDHQRPQAELEAAAGGGRDHAVSLADSRSHLHHWRHICTSRVERLNGTRRLFLKRLNRLTLCFSKKLENLEAAFAMFAPWYNFVWQTREKGNSGKLRPTAAMMAGLAAHV